MVLYERNLLLIKKDKMASFLSALFGAIIGGYCAILGVDQGKFQEEKNNLIGVLVKQRYGLKISSDAQSRAKQLEEQYIEILICYNKLLSVSPSFLKSRIKVMWKVYKGDFDDYIVLFGRQDVWQTGKGSWSAASTQFSREEIEQKIDQFILELQGITGFLSALLQTCRTDFIFRP